jgi:hypothetical protein
MRSRFERHIRPVTIEVFQAALDAKREGVERGRQSDLKELATGEPVIDVTGFLEEREDNAFVDGVTAVLDLFDRDMNMAQACQFRAMFLMSLITSRKFRKYRRTQADGTHMVHGTFVTAVCSMPFPNSLWHRGRRMIKRRLASYIRRLEKQGIDETE